MTTWKLFLDDEREPEMVYGQVAAENWSIARNTEEAKFMVLAMGIPKEMSLDHDLGGDDTSIAFLGWLSHEFWKPDTMAIPRYKVHSANPVGRENIIAFMESWKKSLTL